MRTSICLIALVACAFAVAIERPDNIQLSTSRSALKFGNYTAPGVTADQITAFKNFANSASSFYKDDVAANAQYIKEQMDSQFGDAVTNFFVIIQTQNVRFSWLVWITSENCVANLAGINRINPDWSYMFLKFFAPTTSPDYAFITPISKGSGVDADDEAFIADVINTYESGNVCTCNDYETQNIGYGLINGQGIPWSTICDAAGITYAHVYTVGGMWISTKPKNCYYTFYVSQ